MFRSMALCGEGQAERVKLIGHRILQAHPELQSLIDAYPKMTMQWDVAGGEAFTRDMLAYGVPKVCAFVADVLDKGDALTPAALTRSTMPHVSQRQRLEDLGDAGPLSR